MKQVPAKLVVAVSAIAASTYFVVGGGASVALHADIAHPPLVVTQAGAPGDLGFATKPIHKKAGSATCTPAGTALCTAFETGCGFVGGGLSTSPDGGVTCSVAKTKAASFAAAQGFKANSGSAKAEVANCESDGTDDGNAICSGFGTACSKLGCGPSTEPDGSVTCTC
jgi:hypothetical protein